MNDLVIETRDLTKKYGSFTAVDALNLSIKQGEIFGLLGPNGAGKTTTILMLLGLTEPTSGTVNVLGVDPSRDPLGVKARVGYMPDQVGFYDELTAWENLMYIAKLNGIPRQEAYKRIDAVLRRVGLHKLSEKRVGTFSRGMRQRLGVADVLIKQPKVIIMDEPTQGLDPEGAHEFLDMIRSLRKEEGITLLLSSHLLHQVQETCDRVGLFHRGKMVLEGSVDELARRILGGAYRIQIEVDQSTPKIEAALQSLPGAVKVSLPRANVYEIEAQNDLRTEALSAAISAGGRIIRLSMEMQSLDAIYTQYFKEVEHVSA